MVSPTLLIIDDEPSILESLSLFLQDEGYQVLTAANGKEGLDLFFAHEVDLVITDLRMPVMDGNQVMEALRDHARENQIPEPPVIVISGVGKRRDVIRALRMGAKDYITKPAEDLDRISHTIEQVIKTRRLEAENIRYRQELEKSEAQYRAITHQIAEGVFTVDIREHITFTNPAFCKMLGFTSAELKGRDFTTLVATQALPLIQRQTLRRKSGKNDQYEIQMPHKDGHLVHVELSCSPLLDDQGEYTGSIAVIRDITHLMELRRKYEAFKKTEQDRTTDLLALCANCKSIRDADQGWIQMEAFFRDITFTHGICPSCCETLYPDLDLSNLEDLDDDA